MKKLILMVMLLGLIGCEAPQLSREGSPHDQLNFVGSVSVGGVDCIVYKDQLGWGAAGGLSCN